MQHHVVNSYSKASGVLTFPRTKKIMVQCQTYMSCLQAVHYSREQAMKKQDNKKKQTNKTNKHGAVVKFKNII